MTPPNASPADAVHRSAWSVGLHSRRAMKSRPAILTTSGLASRSRENSQPRRSKVENSSGDTRRTRQGTAAGSVAPAGLEKPGEALEDRRPALGVQAVDPVRAADEDHRSGAVPPGLARATRREERGVAEKPIAEGHARAARSRAARCRASRLIARPRAARGTGATTRPRTLPDGTAESALGLASACVQRRSLAARPIADHAVDAEPARRVQERQQVARPVDPRRAHVDHVPVEQVGRHARPGHPNAQRLSRGESVERPGVPRRHWIVAVFPDGRSGCLWE